MIHAPTKLAAAAAVLAALPVSQLSAQNTHLDSPSSIAGGTAVVRLKGNPGSPYMIWWSSEESLTQVGDIFLDVDPFRSLQFGFHIEGFLDSNGLSTHQFPTTPEWDLGRLSFEAVTTKGADMDISNLARSTFQIPGTFRDAVGLPASLSILGDLFPLADGRILAIGGAGPVVEEYQPWDQQTLPAGLANPSYVLSARAQLADGKILVAGGLVVGTASDGTTPTIATTDEAYIFNPTTGDYLPTLGKLASARAGASATTLPNGKVLVFGGLGAIDLSDPTSLLTAILSSSEIYDPATGAFSAGPTLVEGKAFHTATRLDNGQVLVAGGLATALGIPFVSNTGYTYNPNNNTFGFLPKIFTGGRLFHTATKLANGKVALTGGFDADLSGVIQSGNLSQITFGTVGTTALFDPAAGLGGSFSAGPAMLEARALHTASALANGTLLVAGGLSGTIDLGGLLSGNPGSIQLPAVLGTSELLGFAPASATAGPPLNAPRAGACAIVSPMDARVIVFGGGPLQAELYQQ